MKEELRGNETGSKGEGYNYIGEWEVVHGIGGGVEDTGDNGERNEVFMRASRG